MRKNLVVLTLGLLAGLLTAPALAAQPVVTQRGAAGARQVVDHMRSLNAPYVSVKNNKWQGYKHYAQSHFLVDEYTSRSQKRVSSKEKRVWKVSEEPGQKILGMEVVTAKGTRTYAGEALERYLANPKRAPRPKLVPLQPTVKAIWN